MSFNESRTYADFGVKRTLLQLKAALQNDPQTGMEELWEELQVEEARMQQIHQAPIEGLRMIEIGPGQGLERTRYFSLKNDVTALDLDVIAQHFSFLTYWQMLRKNGVGRVLKTMGRKAIVNPKNHAAWAKVVGVRNFGKVKHLQGSIENVTLPDNSYDAILSWSVWEHLPDPVAAVQNVKRILRPGGFFFIRLHLYTCNNGHHDMRSFAGDENALPLWAHLRPEHVDRVRPSAYLNEWRLDQWRALFEEETPGHREYLDQYEHPEKYGPLLENSLRDELREYSREELLTVNVTYAWKKPDPASS